MKSFYFGNATDKVYSEETREELRKLTGIKDGVYTKEDILVNPQDFKDTEYIFTSWGMAHFEKEEIKEYLPKLKAVFYGAGSVQHFAREFLELGIKVYSAWGANAVPVAEYTLAQIILANKGFFRSCRMTKSPESRQDATRYAFALPGNYDCKVGIIGAGMIGKSVIKRLKALNVDILVYDPFLPDEKADELGVTKASLEKLFSECQTISNHVANLPQTVGMLNYGLFKLMKDDAVFINTGRGAQVVEDDLIRALEEKPDMCAVLDVTMPEPPVEGSKLYTLPNVFITPHIAGSLGNEVRRMGEYMLDQYKKYADGKPCEYEVSIKMLETMA